MLSIASVGGSASNAPIAGAHVPSFRTCLLALLLIFCVPGTLAAQQTIHVPADQPTIQAGIDAAQIGDTVLVAPGTYRENIVLNEKAITVTSGATTYEDAATTIIEGQTAAPTVLIESLQYVKPPASVLNGFTIRHVSGVLTTESDTGDGVAAVVAGAKVTHNQILGNLGCGIAAWGSYRLLAQGNLISSPSVGDCGTLAGQVLRGLNEVYAVAGSIAIYGGGDVIDNRIVNSHALPFSSQGIAYSQTISATVRGNILTGNSGAGSSISFRGVFDTYLIQNLIENNSTTDRNAPSIIRSGPVGNNTLVMVNNTVQAPLNYPEAFDLADEIGTQNISNNLFIGTVPGQVIRCYYIVAGNSAAPQNVPPAGAVFKDNDVYGKATAQNYTCASPSGTSGNLSTDPRFVDPANGNFHLQRSSPAVAAGDANAPMLPPLDLDDRNRTVCGTVDLGVYELHPQPAISVTSSNNPSAGTTPVTFTANVAGNCNVPTGTVTFFDGATPLGTQTLSAGASASLTTAALIVGSHNITVSYAGDANFDPSTSVTLVQVVTGYATTLTCTASPNPALLSGFVAHGTVASLFGTPTGTVTFQVAGGVGLSGGLVKGSADVSLPNPGPGTSVLTGTYSGDTQFAPGTCTLSEAGVGLASTVSLSGSPNPAVLGQVVTFTAAVRPATNLPTGSIAPSGTVTFADGGAPLGTVPLGAGGAATFSASTLAAGTHNITATYSGDKTFGASSASLSETVLYASTMTSLNASPNPAGLGAAVTLTATVAPSNSSAIAGMIVFQDNGTQLGTAPVGPNGVGTFTTSTLALGSHPITALFTSGNGLGSSTSGTVTVQIVAPAFTLTLQPAQLALASGSSGTVAVQLASVGGYAGALALRTGSLPAYVTATFLPPTVPLPSGGAGTATLTIATPAITAQRHTFYPDRGRFPDRERTALATLAAALSLTPFGWRRRRRLATRILLFGCSLLLLGTIGCTNVRYAVHIVQPGTYLIPVIATDTNGNTQTATLQLVIRP